jgi:hypothetical protein
MSSRQQQANPFLNATNYNKIVSFLRQHYSSKLGLKAVPERMETRLQKTVQHYMTEIARIQGPAKPLPAMNQEVLRETTSSIDTWLKRQESATPPPTTTVGNFPKDTEYARLFEDTNSRYESLIAERSPAPVTPAAVPDFRLPATAEEEEDPVVLMQRIQKQRDEQARTSTNSNPPRLQITEDKPPSITNPVPVQAEAPPPLLAPRQQDYIIPQEDIVKYRETEYNIFLTSSDRDWVRNTTENRYNFSVIFNTGNTTSALGYNAAVQQRFRNIQRIEFVKAIVPIESLVPLVRVATSNGTLGTYDTSRVVNVFSLPFTSVRIAELNNNGFSTKPEEDNTFAIVQYDTTWSSDLVVPPATSSGNNYTGSSSVVATKSGYTGLIPKFLKAQRIYTPTPLATLNKLSIRLERHTTDLLNSDSDVLAISRILLGGNITVLGADNTKYAGITSPLNPYIFISTSSYFLYSAVSEGDLINIQGFAVTATGSTTQAACDDFATYINRSSGHYVVAVGYSVGGATSLGRNDAGYCNVIILRSRFDNPATTGGTTRTSSYFGGDVGQEAVGVLPTTLNGAAVQTTCSLINMSRQVHVVLRIITRDFDSGSNIRPDNV